MSDKWVLGMEGGMNGHFYSIVSQTGEVIAMQIPSRPRADEIIYAHNNEDAMLDALKVALSALRSYQYGNDAPYLAEEVAERVQIVIAKAEGVK